MAGFTQSHHGVLQALFDVMGVRWGRGATNRALEAFYSLHMPSFGSVQGVVHAADRSTMRLDASLDRQTSILA